MVTHSAAGEVVATRFGTTELVHCAGSGMSTQPGIDDVTVVKGPGGWRTGETKQLETVFGVKRASRVKRIETDHFAIYTDSAAARGSFSGGSTSNASR